MNKSIPVSLAEIERAIHTLRDHRVMLDSDLASIYGVSIKRLNEQVKRNNNRFPPDFMFQLNQEEWEGLRSQNATLNLTRGRHRKYLPYAFTEHGAIMLANVLKSNVAVQASIQVVRAFLHLRELAVTHRDILQKINAMERKYDTQFKAVFDAIRQMMFPTNKTGNKIGF